MKSPKGTSLIPAMALRAIVVACVVVLMTLGLPSMEIALAKDPPSASPSAKTRAAEQPKEQSKEKPEGQSEENAKENAEDQPEPLPDPFPDMTADVRTTLVDLKGHTSISKVQIHRTGNIVRFEHNDLDPPEVSIMNYEESKDYRIYHKDEIYFETEIPNRMTAKAQRDGLIPLQRIRGLERERIFLREATIDGHPCDIILRIRYAKDRRELGTEYTLLWEARDLDRQPIRVAYYQVNLALALVEYTNIKLTPIDLDLVQPPPDYMSLSPF